VETLRSYLELWLRDSYEILIVDDGSADQTGAIALALASRHPTIKVGHHVSNRGLDAAVRTGVEMSSGDYVVVWDADLTYATSTIEALVGAAQRGSYDIVLASAYMRGGKSTAVPFLRRWLSRSANWLLSLAVHAEFATLTCMVRLYRRAILEDLLTLFPQAGTTFEILLAARAHGAAIHEIPAHLDWSAQSIDRAKRMAPGRMLKSVSNVVCCALRYRPALLFAIPGLFPGLLPLAVATAVLFHGSVRTVWYVALITMVLQYASLLAFTWQLRAFFTRIFGRKRVMSLD